jgi:hypothetical protein
MKIMMYWRTALLLAASSRHTRPRWERLGCGRLPSGSTKTARRRTATSRLVKLQWQHSRKVAAGVPGKSSRSGRFALRAGESGPRSTQTAADADHWAGRSLDGVCANEGAGEEQAAAMIPVPSGDDLALLLQEPLNLYPRGLLAKQAF